MGSRFDVKAAEDREERVMRGLKGQRKHYCPEWDFMAIDETMPEFEACYCYDGEPSISPVEEEGR